MPIYPNDLFPISDVQPFTKNDSYTFLDRLNAMTDLVNQVEGDFKTLVKNTADIVNVLNGRIGSPEPLFVDLSHGNVDVEIPDTYPAGHSFWLIVRQGASGGNKIVLPSNITGEFTLSPKPFDYTPLLIHPTKRLSTDYFVDQTINKLVAIINSLDAKIVAEVDKANKAVADAKAAMDKAVEDLTNNVSTAKTELTKKVNEAKEAMTQALKEKSDALTKLVDDNTLQLRRDMNQLEARITTSTTQNNKALETKLTGQMSTLREWCETTVKAIVVNVKDYGAKGDGTTDDHAAITRAVEAAGEGGTVYFPTGKYRVTKTLNTLKGQLWQGPALNSDSRPESSGSHIFADHAGICINMGKDKSASIHSMRIQGSGYQNKDSVGIYCVSSSITLRDVAIWNFQRATYFKEVWYGVIDRCHFMENQYSAYIEYCYNLTFIVPRMYCNRGDGIRGVGVYMADRSMVSFHGGSIEDYAQAFYIMGGCSLYFAGMYFESAFDDKNKTPFEVVYVHDSGINNSVVAIGNQVYLTHHEAFIDFSKPGCGEFLMSYGNRFKCTADNKDGIVYKIAGSDNLTYRLLGDAFADAAGRKMNYISNVAALNAGSIVSPGPGVPDNQSGVGGGMQINIGGGLKITNRITGAVPGLGLGVLPEPLTASRMPGGWYGKNQGTLAYFTNINKPGYWNGTNWIGFDGATLA